MRGGGGGMMEDDVRVGHAQIPNSFGHELRACLRCRLVKTYDQVPTRRRRVPLAPPLRPRAAPCPLPSGRAFPAGEPPGQFSIN